MVMAPMWPDHRGAGRQWIGHHRRGLAVPLLAAKFFSADGTGLNSDAVRCLDYARKMGAVLVNASWGSDAESAALTAAIGRLEAAGILLVAAAGNDGADIDLKPVFPASSRNGNVIAVAALEWNGDFWPLSNFGSGSVDIAAPGVGILSTAGGADDAYVGHPARRWRRRM